MAQEKITQSSIFLELMLKIILVKRKIKIKYDKSKPNGVLRKVMDISLAKKYGWKSKINLKRFYFNDL